jgi:3(or 17)beta-hydroxysteroid dehydrogenase
MLAAMGRVEGKICLVTGAASGIGTATAELLAREGGLVVRTDREAGGGVVAHEVTREADWERVIEDVLARRGRLDVLVNNAGIGGSGVTVEDTTLEEWRSVLAVNLDGVFLGVKHGVRAMRRTGRGGSIVNVSSILGLVGLPLSGAYSASKGGVRLLTKTAALEMAAAGTGIRVNSVHPGFIRTPLVASRLEGPKGDVMAKRIQRTQPTGEMGEPQDVAEAILYLASDASKFVTGSELVVDGGATAR